MSLKLKALSLGLLAAVALSAVLVANAGATRSGHFTSDAATATTTVTGSENPTHRLEFSSASLEGFGITKPIVCKVASYHGTITGNTTEEVRVTPTWQQCETTPEDGAQAVTVHTEGCQLKLTSRTAPGDATGGLVCPTGKKVTITSHNGCTLRFGNQTVANATTYDTLTLNNKHAITLNATGAGITFTAHNGPCIFVPTTFNDGTLKGSVTVTGDDANGNAVNITST